MHRRWTWTRPRRPGAREWRAEDPATRRRARPGRKAQAPARRGDPGGASPPATLPRQLEAQLHEPLEVGLCTRVDVPVDPSEVRRGGVLRVLPLVVHRAVEDVERLDAQLEAHLVGDPRGLGDVHINFPEARTPELVVTEVRGAALEVLPDQEERLRAAIGNRVRLEVVLAGRGVVV